MKASTLPQNHSRAPREQILRDLVDKNLSRWDLNKDGKISPTEVDSFVSDPKIEGLDAATLATLKWTFRKFPEMGHPGIDSSTQFSGKQHYGMGVLERFETYRDGLERSETLFEGGLPDPQSIRQGMRGSCSLLAGLTVQAQQNPQSLVDSIREENDGFRVFFTSFDEFVSKPTPTERLTSAWSNGVWATVYEKATAQKNFKKLPETGDVYDNLDRGLPSQGVIGEISGDTLSRMISLSATPDPVQAAELAKDAMPYPTLLTVVHQELERGMEEGRIGIAATSLNPRTGVMSKGSHAYAVIDYDPQSLEVTLRNPWGHTDLKDLPGVIEDPVDDGVFKTTIDGFLQHFHTLDVGSDELDVYVGLPAESISS